MHIYIPLKGNLTERFKLIGSSVYQITKSKYPTTHHTITCQVFWITFRLASIPTIFFIIWIQDDTCE